MKDITPSGFQFSNPKTKKINFEINENFDKSKYEGVSIRYNVKISKQEESSAVVELAFHIGEIGDQTPFYLELIISSKFRWTDNIEYSSEKLLKQNASTLLMSYARPIVAYLTANAGLPPFNIPFIDLRNDFKEIEN